MGSRFWILRQIPAEERLEDSILSIDARGKRKLIAQLNSFGFTGSIVCLVLEEAGEVTARGAVDYILSSQRCLYPRERGPNTMAMARSKHERNSSDYSMLSIPSTLRGDTEMEESVYESAFEGDVEDGESGYAGVPTSASSAATKKGPIRHFESEEQLGSLKDHGEGGEKKERAYLIPFSAKTPAALRALVSAWVDFLRLHKEQKKGKGPSVNGIKVNGHSTAHLHASTTDDDFVFSLRELATLLCLGRDHYKCRRGLVVTELRELEELDVDAFVDDEPVPVLGISGDASAPHTAVNGEILQEDQEYKTRLVTLLSGLDPARRPLG